MCVSVCLCLCVCLKSECLKSDVLRQTILEGHKESYCETSTLVYVVFCALLLQYVVPSFDTMLICLSCTPLQEAEFAVVMDDTLNVSPDFFK